MTQINAVQQGSITIIDDDFCVRAALDNLLHSVGYVTQCFSSAEAFLARDCRHVVNCAIMDIRLSAMSGFALKAHLNAMQILLPVIFISGHASAAERKQAFSLGAAAFLIKPIDTDILLSEIRRLTPPAGESD